MKLFDKLTNLTNDITKKIVKKPVTVTPVAPITKASKKRASNNEVIIPMETIEFPSVASAAAYLVELCDLKVTNAKDCIYKALKGTGKTHGFYVEKTEDGKITLASYKVEKQVATKVEESEPVVEVEEASNDSDPFDII